MSMGQRLRWSVTDATRAPAPGDFAQQRRVPLPVVSTMANAGPSLTHDRGTHGCRVTTAAPWTRAHAIRIMHSNGESNPQEQALVVDAVGWLETSGLVAGCGLRDGSIRVACYDREGCNCAEDGHLRHLVPPGLMTILRNAR